MKRSHRWCGVWASCVLACGAPGSHSGRPHPSQPVPPSPPLVVEATGLTFPLEPPPMTPLAAIPAFKTTFKRPVLLTHAPEEPDRVYVLEQEGLVHTVSLTDGSRSVWLDLHERVRRIHNEEGLLGLAFDPEYPRSGIFYVFYSASGPRRSQVSRFRRGEDGNGDPNSEEPILAVDQPYGNHNGGTVAFGPDGYLYAGFGDGGWGGDPLNAGQDLTTLLGKMVRVDVEDSGPFEVPLDNPFVGVAGARGEIWAFGLRNPWRFTFDRQTGDLWAGDVGQDAMEEIDRIVKGGNYGWRRKEGTRTYRPISNPASMIDPVIEYGRDLGGSVTGGYVYRGHDLPGYRGAYFYGDYVSGNIWALRMDGDTVARHDLVARVGELASFGEDHAGELYAVSLAGRVFRFTMTSPDEGQARFPTKLSETGLFTDTATLTPAPGLLPFTPIVALWSDGAEKTRWLALPKGGKIGFDESGEWSFPVGTVTVKHFELPVDTETKVRLETRVMVHEAAGWAGYSYRWNRAQTEAELVTTRQTDTIEVVRAGQRVSQRWTFPAGSDCLGCHTAGYGRVLGLRTRQLNGPGDRNTIAIWRDAGLFDHDIGDLARLPAHPRLEDETRDVETRVRAYLDVNCALCHHPGGPTPSGLDLRVETPMAMAGLWGLRPQQPMGLPDEQLVHPRAHASSSLWGRMTAAERGRMPPVFSSVVDEAAAALVARWIDTLDNLGDPR